MGKSSNPNRSKGISIGDGVVNIQDLVLVAGAVGSDGAERCRYELRWRGEHPRFECSLSGAFGNTAAAPSLHAQTAGALTAADVQAWLTQAQQLGLTDPAYLRGITVLQHLLCCINTARNSLAIQLPQPV